MNRTAWVPAVLLAAGAAFVAVAALDGGVRFAVVVVLPVFYGGSWEFGVGLLLLVAGLFTLPLAFGVVEVPEVDGPGPAPPPPGGAGGLVLIGPVPIFFGSWRGVSARARILVAVLGAALLVGAVTLLVFGRV